MARLFLRIFYLTFLWIILLANLLFVFDMASIMSPTVAINQGDLTNRYFGVSTLIEAFKNLDNMPLGQVATKLGGFQKQLFNYASSMFNNLEWPDYNNPQGFWNDLLTSLVSIGQMIASIFIYTIGLILFIIYFIMLLLTLVFTVFNLLSGYYSNEVPTHLMWGLGNFIAPLLPLV